MAEKDVEQAKLGGTSCDLKNRLGGQSARTPQGVCEKACVSQGLTLISRREHSVLTQRTLLIMEVRAAIVFIQAVCAEMQSEREGRC